jgi:hypothetical protein
MVRTGSLARVTTLPPVMGPGHWYAADGVVVHQDCVEAAIATLDADRPR